MRKKVFSLALVLSLLLSLGCSASAASPRMEEINNAKAILAFSSTTAICNASVSGKTGTTRMEINIYLQKANSNGDYITEVSWPRTVYSDEFTLDTTISYRTAGKYRLLVEATVYGSSGRGEFVSAESFATCS